MVKKAEEFPLGSMESRAAARAMLEAQESGVRRVQIIIAAPRPRREGESHIKMGAWFETPDGGLTRYVFVPPGTDEETLRQLLAV